MKINFRKVASNKRVENSREVIFKEHLFFLNKKSNVTEIKKVLGEIKARFPFWLKVILRKMASNKHVELRKVDVILKIYRKKVNFKKSF